MPTNPTSRPSSIPSSNPTPVPNLLGGATPSTSQTTQYLLRNEILKEVAECRDEIAYQRGLSPEKRETEVAVEALSKAIKRMDEYLALAPPDVLKTAQSALSKD